MSSEDAQTEQPHRIEPHRISVVIPVYQGERTLPGLLAEIEPLTKQFDTPGGNSMLVAEVLLVFDNGKDGSAGVIRHLDEQYDFVRPIWLSRNFGQHAATIAGMASSGAEWIATLDEDGQHDPNDIARMLDVALSNRAGLVYAAPTNEAPHGRLRNTASFGAKKLATYMIGSDSPSRYHSYRLMLGEIGRSVAAYAGPGVYLDVAVGWVTDAVAVCPLELRDEGQRVSGYTTRSLLSHFWRMVLSSGTRGLRLVSALGVFFAALGVLLAIGLAAAKLAGSQVTQGWTSIVVVLLFSTGAILFSLGVIAEYLGVAVGMAMGKPLYLIVGDSADGPLGRAEQDGR